jgi:hypothetical protein
VTLSEYLRTGASEPFVWGKTDCCAWTSGWVREACGLDPVAPYLSRYRTEIGAARLVTQGGGFMAWVSACVEAVGLAETEAPIPGDIGIVEDRSGNKAVAICAGRVWAAKAPTGLLITEARPLRAWRVPCLR